VAGRGVAIETSEQHSCSEVWARERAQVGVLLLRLFQLNGLPYQQGELEHLLVLGQESRHAERLLQHILQA